MVVEKKQLEEQINSMIQNYEKISTKIETKLSPQHQFELQPRIEQQKPVGPKEMMENEVSLTRTKREKKTAHQVGNDILAKLMGLQ